eukprot:CAMPEP_0181367610 /NCGR_PEP_ID=MMETSP1106-20121128/11521_1 /TAXON_ID=81844 /ORGANISM="Mantoniella antarctica, Strain SL-175" /LENGTH=69 /DNA_ID=CAMNT_0023483421 /DNA_START=40 /DNA_END=249 /DNA_ORIENTATION=+
MPQSDGGPAIRMFHTDIPYGCSKARARARPVQQGRQCTLRKVSVPSPCIQVPVPVPRAPAFQGEGNPKP